ncbi:hypothetical protein STRTUCAR8_03490 [Streptomyces turgidiscabies Car8]|uniref:Uncharacterized protein n=1 Tax=Streptomyces turgidiscabies (strain Car8) TaxID=698760 RepID=L7FA99_STRT8|nr:hypothetical protein STRTUCAR8_03490 [Streptomyces turgidiscabies Car8]
MTAPAHSRHHAGPHPSIRIHIRTYTSTRAGRAAEETQWC